jgi:hypothetical protein
VARPTPVDALVALLFGIAADRPDPAEEFAHGPRRWLGRDQAAGYAVDVLLVPPPRPRRRPPPVTVDRPGRR